MNRYVTVKSNKYGLVLYLNSDIAFETLRREVERTFKGTAGFFGKSRLAVSFEGRILTKEQEQQLIEAISKNAQLEIVCIIDNDEKREKMYKRAVEDTLFPEYGKDGIFCKGTLHKNQVLESETSIVILGDVEKGATVVAKGNIIVLGSLLGKAYAGIGGVSDSFILSFMMHPQKIRIGNVKARIPDEEMSITPQIAIRVKDTLQFLPFPNVQQTYRRNETWAKLL